MKNATPNNERNVLLNDKYTITPGQCNHIVASIKSNTPANKLSFTSEVIL
jgi:hypothetical protein